MWERTIQPFHVEFVENKVNIGQGFLRELQYSLVSSVPPLFQIIFLSASDAVVLEIYSVGK